MYNHLWATFGEMQIIHSLCAPPTSSKGCIASGMVEDPHTQHSLPAHITPRVLICVQTLTPDIIINFHLHSCPFKSISQTTRSGGEFVASVCFLRWLLACTGFCIHTHTYIKSLDASSNYSKIQQLAPSSAALKLC